MVEDEAEIRELMCYNLLKEGYSVVGAASGEEALELVHQQIPSLVVLDLMLPGIDGLSVCRRLRNDPKLQAVPVLIVSAKGGEADVVAGLNLGADDYLPKPFSPKVFVARVRAVLRRASQPQEVQQTTVVKTDVSDQPMQAGELLIHPGHYQVVRGETTIDLTATEFRVLAFLAGKPGRVFTRQQILDGVHGDNYAITDRAIDVQIVAIRKKLGEAGRYIETVRGIGYRFRDALPDAPAT